MTQTQIGSFEPIPLQAIRPSSTNPRKHFDPAAMEELTQSVREIGVTQPILVRPCFDQEDGDFEVVTGERRYRAAQNAGLENIPAIVREMSDAEAMDLQMVENLQRADLHPVEEAEGYRALMAGGASAEDCAKKAGKTLGYVQQRLKLLTLEVDAKQLFADGHMTLGHALLLARLTPREQQKALLYLLGLRDWEIYKKIPFSDTVAKTVEILEAQTRDRRVRARVIERSEAQLQDWIRSNVLLQLGGVPWDLGDALLLPIAGPCTTCPKRTGANAALFQDITTAEDTCTDPACFGDKQKAFSARAQAQAKETGSPLLKISAKTSTEKLAAPAVELQPSKVVQLGTAAVATKRPVVVAKKAVKQGQWVPSEEGACPKTVQAIVVDGPDQGKTKWVCADQACKVHKHTVSRPGDSSSVSQPRETEEQRAAREKAYLESETPVRIALMKAIQNAPDSGKVLRAVAHQINGEHCRSQAFVCAVYGWTLSSSARGYQRISEAEKVVAKQIETMEEHALEELILMLVFADDVEPVSWRCEEKAHRLKASAIAKSLGLNLDKIAATVEAKPIDEANDKLAEAKATRSPAKRVKTPAIDRKSAAAGAVAESVGV